MKRRPAVLAATAVAVAFVMAPRPSARADTIASNTATYKLTTSTDIPAADQNSTAPQVVAQVVPPGTVVPPTNADGTQGSPLTVLKSSTGFDPTQLIVALKDNVSNGGGAPEQLFGLSFFGKGLSKTGELDFSLNLSKAATTPPTLQSMTPGVSITALQTTTPPPTTPTPPPTTPTSASVPEPVSLVLWSVLAGCGLLRARAVRRRRAAHAAS